MQTAKDKANNNREYSKTGLFIFGCYLICGSAYSFLSGEWFFGFPLQLDMFLMFSGKTGIYAEATIAGLLGLTCTIITIFPLAQPAKAEQETALPASVGRQ